MYLLHIPGLKDCISKYIHIVNVHNRCVIQSPFLLYNYGFHVVYILSLSPTIKPPPDSKASLSNKPLKVSSAK